LPRSALGELSSVAIESQHKTDALRGSAQRLIKECRVSTEAKLTVFYWRKRNDFIACSLGRDLPKNVASIRLPQKE
jgi:hypothetical protein